MSFVHAGLGDAGTMRDVEKLIEDVASGRDARDVLDESYLAAAGRLLGVGKAGEAHQAKKDLKKATQQLDAAWGTLQLAVNTLTSGGQKLAEVKKIQAQMAAIQKVKTAISKLL